VTVVDIETETDALFKKKRPEKGSGTFY